MTTHQYDNDTPNFSNDCARCGHGYIFHEQLGACSMPGCDCLAFIPQERKRP